MDVKGGYPWWTVRNGLLRDYPPLSDDLECEVVVVGAGITGALIARGLVGAGLDTVVLDRRNVGWGSTAASTALLQYEIDTELLQLAKLVSEQHALAAYKACEAALCELRAIAEDICDIGWREAPSLYLASSRRDARRLRPEFEARCDAGLRVEWLEESALHERFGLAAPAAILSRPAAQVDPYRFAHRLFEKLCAQGLRVFDRCKMTEWKPDAGALEIRVATGARVRAQWLVVAAGYESQSLLRHRVAKNRSSYAFVSEPLQLCRSSCVASAGKPRARTCTGAAATALPTARSARTSSATRCVENRIRWPRYSGSGASRFSRARRVLRGPAAMRARRFTRRSRAAV